VTIHPQLLEKAETRKFIEKIGITEPSLQDQIYNIILPRYQNGSTKIDTYSDLKVFFKYYRSCPASDLGDFFERIRECEFVGCYRNGDNEIFRYKPKEMYMPTDELTRFFEGKPDTYFVLIDEYMDLVDYADEKKLESFFEALGVESVPKIVPKSTGGYNYNEKEYFIDGLTEIIHNVVNKQDISLSVFVWDELCSFIKENLLNQTVLEKEVTSRRDGRYKWHTTHVESSTAVLLKSQSWLVDKDGVFVSPDQISVDRLSDRYDMQNPNARDLIKILDIPERAGQKRGEDWDKLTEEQREQIEFAEKCKELGITLGDLEEIAKLKRMREKQERRPVETADKKDGTENLFENDEDFDLEGTGDNQPPHRKLNRATKRVIKDLIQRTPIASSVAKDITNESVEDDVDQDEFTPVTVDYSKKIEQAKQKSADEIAKIVHFEELQQTALTSPRYSFLWFKTLLEMEMLNSSESTANSKEISISFAQVELETGTQRTLILKHPNRYIPQFMEDLADIPLVLHMETQTKTVAVEVANIQSYTLRVKLKTNAEIKGVDLTSVTEATINAKNPVFLMEELYKKFAALEYEDEFNMQSNLCENIEFVFGPPGTGKTTYLASEILIPLVRQHQDLKVLVLTPTNKAADVLTNRIMEISGDDTSYNDWLVRFGTTNDEVVENSEVYRDKTFDPRSLKRNVTVTTIARFPYDFFMPNGTRLYLHSINWDYIVIDESSMIPLVNIVYVLYQKTPQKFIIAGDPFQIEPITTVDLWKNENIYTLVKLNSFENPTTIPHPYKVKLLTTQYRSIPVVGDIFSKLTYGGILNHFRPASSQRQLNIDKIFQMKTLNLIKFPVSKYESIYRAKRLQHGSPYQVYSALFTFELANYISNIIARNNAGSLFKIGIVAPYRAQADLIDKLLASVSTPKTVEVQVSTIHGFQGDECDIIIAVFNTPPTISSSAEMFLNKRNIINVSISRARDYLFVIMPDDATNNIDNLTLIKRVESLMKETDDCQEFSSEELEILMFDNPHYLEENSFSTSHQSVNVYGLPEKDMRFEQKKLRLMYKYIAIMVGVHSLAGFYGQQRDTRGKVRQIK